MLLGGDLGFWCSLVVVVVGWFIGRRKWRRVVARKVEIRRLMMLASEETARAELEAAVGYGGYGSAEAPAVASVEEPEPVVMSGSSPARQVQYHCEVCLSPTTTRCKQCKAVRYCSRKCQITHWREGHKDECVSFIARRSIEGGLQSHFKEFKQDEVQSSQDVVGSGITHTTKPVELPSDEHMVSNALRHVLSENNDTETEISGSWKKTDGNLKESLQLFRDDCSADVVVTEDGNLKDCNRDYGQSPDKKLGSMKPLLSVQPNLINPEIGMAASSDPNELKSGCIDEKSESSTSSGGNVTASEEHLFAEPSKPPPSDFWGGSVKPNRSKIDALGEFRDVNILNSRSSRLQSSGGINSGVETLSSDVNRVRDEVFPSTSMSSKSTDISVRSEDDLKSRVQLLSCNLAGQNSAKNAFIDCSSTKEAKVSSSSAFCEDVSEGLAPGNHIDGISNLQSLTSPEMLDHEFDGTNGNLDAVKETDSSRLRASETHSTSTSNAVKSISDAQAVQNEFSHADSAFAFCSRCYLLSAKGGSNVSTKRVMSQLKTSNFIRHGSLGSESGAKEPHEGGSFSYELFVKLYNWNKTELCPSGLINCGNSCYANAVLQCLALTPPLTAYFLQGLHAKDCKKKEWCFTCELEALVSKAKESKFPLSPARIMSEVQQIGRHLGHGREEDAHEFLRSAIDAMQSVYLKETRVNTPSSLDEETTLLGLTFGGYLQSKIECMGCGGKSKQHERIMDLTVEISGEIGTLEDALRQFTRSEILDGENKYHCGRCRLYQKAKKKLRVLEAPNVLTVALKRFQSGKFGKLNKAVKFPQILNLARYMSRTSDKSPIYQLYGVVVHLDNMNATFSGHYVCYVKNNHGRWYKADDSVVQKVEILKVLSQDAYMLFYSRCSPRAPRPIRSLMVQRDPRKACKSQPHPPELWSTSEGGLNHDICASCTSQNGTSSHPSRPDSVCDSEHSSFFSDGRSYSTESSNSESMSTNDSFDQILGDGVHCWNAHCRSTSDSDTTSSSSSSSWSSSPNARHSPLANMDRYSSDTEASSSPSANGSPSSNPDGFWARSHSKITAVSPGDGQGRCNECKAGSSSCKNIDKSNRLGSSNNVKGVYI